MKYYPEGTNTALLKNFETVDEVKAAIKNQTICESKALLCDKNHNLHIDLGIMRGIIPHSEGAVGIDDGRVRDIALISKVNKPVCFVISDIKADEYGQSIAILSRRKVQQKALEQYINYLNAGDVIDARVTRLEGFGAFIDIGCGINSLIPIDMMSVSRISHPSERLYDGELVRCVLRKREPTKLTFTIKELLGTWEQNAGQYSVGETVTGVVRSVESYGVFVELLPNLAGLAEPCDNLKIGQSVSVYIKAIVPDKMKIKLVIVSTFDEIVPPAQLVYMFDGEHMDYWRYSPQNATKLIETQF